MIELLGQLLPEIVLCATACMLLVISSLGGASARRLAPVLAVLALLIAGAIPAFQYLTPSNDRNFTNSVGGGVMSQYLKILTAFAGLLFVLLAWPTRTRPEGEEAGGNGSLAAGSESGEYFALMLLSLAGLMLTGSANSLILLFLGLELASIPTYIMVSISRPLPISQEAGVKYFFLGALSAALMLLGFSYLYGATGTIFLEGNGSSLASRGIFEHMTAKLTAAMTALPDSATGPVSAATAALTAGWGVLTPMEIFAVVLLLAGFGFKMAAFPLHAYAADVYQGAATPLTAMLSYVPKAAGLFAILKVLIVLGGQQQLLPDRLTLLVAIIAVITMSLGNALALLQYNVKRVMAYSSIAHSGYMLAGVAAMLAAKGDPILQSAALAAVLFYLAVYAVMNTGVFAVMQQMPARARFGDDSTPRQLEDRGAASAETLEDLAGYGRTHPLLGLSMAVCCLSLVGLPATGGFLGKLLLAKPLLDTGLIWLVVAMMINAAVSAAYYLRIPAAMFFRALPERPSDVIPDGATRSPLVAWPATVVALVCALGSLTLGIVLPASNFLSESAAQATATLPVRPTATPPVASGATDGPVGVSGASLSSGDSLGSTAR